MVKPPFFGPRTIAAGVSADFEELLRRYQITKSVRFEQFSDIWREMKMTCIFCGHERDNELLSFTDECMAIALGFCLPAHSFQWRVGGLYLLYAVYFKQPNTIKAKIRVTHSQWVEILGFIEEVVEQKHHDTHFVFCKLRQHNAFHFVAFPKQMAPYSKEVNNSDGKSYFLESSVLKDMVEEGYCKPIEQLHQKYMQSKQILFKKDTELSVVNEDPIVSFVSKIEKFEKKRLRSVAGYRHKRTGDDDEEEDAGDNQENPSTEDEEKSTIGKRRERLKKKTMSKKAKTSRSRRHRNVEVEMVSPTRITTSPKKKGCRKSRKTSPEKKPKTPEKIVVDDDNYDDDDDDDDDDDNETAPCQLSMPQFT